MFLVESKYFVHRFFWGIATSLRLLDLLRVSALVDEEIGDIQHFGDWVVFGYPRAAGVAKSRRFKSLLCC